MKTITDLKVQKRREDRVSVFLDETYAFSIPASLAAQLQVGQALSEEDCKALRLKGDLDKASEKVARFLSYRPRSRYEVERYLGRKDFAPEVIEAAVAKFEDLGLLDDLDFAQFWVENREEFKPRSVWALRQELRQKGVDSSIIDQVVQDVDERASAHRAATKWARRLRGADYETFRRRLGGFLQRRGFRYYITKDIIERLWEESVGEPEA
jgi:regulatory protein